MRPDREQAIERAVEALVARPGHGPPCWCSDDWRVGTYKRCPQHGWEADDGWKDSYRREAVIVIDAYEALPVEITDEMVERAAEAYDNVRFGIDWQPHWDGMPDAYKEMRQQQMRAGLEALNSVPSVRSTE